MKKLFLTIIMLLTVCVGCFVGCKKGVDKTLETSKTPDWESIGAVPPSKPEGCNLEFWICDDLKDVDLSQYCEIYGWFGARQFYGKDYKPTEMQEDGINFVEPEYCVKYLISGYPDVADFGYHITRIDITDPSVIVYGLTCDAGIEEFFDVFSVMGYEMELNGKPLQSGKIIGGELADTSTLTWCKATKGRFKFVISHHEKNELSIMAESTNYSGIVF